MKKTLLSIISLILYVHSVEGSTPVNITPFRCEMSAPTNQQLIHGVYLIFTVTNLTDNPLQLLRWYTPFEGFLSKLFIIKNKVGEPLNYNGMMVKRSTASNDDYLILPAKEKVKITLNLTQAYSLSSGEYTVQLFPKNLQYLQHEEHLTTQCSANILKIKVFP